MANLGPLQSRAGIVEFDINQRPVDVLEAILARSPRIVGLGVYIWNIDQATRLVGDLKRVRPDIVVVLGGPEVSYETDAQEIVSLADFVITGEADLQFADVCQRLLDGGAPSSKVVAAPLPQFEHKHARSLLLSVPRLTEPRLITLPYDLYSDEDIRHRVIYVEASRGCPFKCEFCLSSLDVPVRNVPTAEFLAAMQRLLDRGVRQFKFVDRTFNLNLNISRAILDFFRERYTPGLFLHFEMIPDRLPDALRTPIASFPAGALQFEVGIQSFNEDVCDRISRRQDAAKVEQNLRWLRAETGVHVHADLIVGLPGEDLTSFGRGFDRLVDLGPQEIQVGMLKRLRGTPIVRHDQSHRMVYSPHAPYEILQTGVIGFGDMQRMRRFARYWDLVANSGNFAATSSLLWLDASPFESFLAFGDWLFGRIGRQHAIALPLLAERLFEYLTEIRRVDRETAAIAIWTDVRQGGRRDGPEFLRPFVPEALRTDARRDVSRGGIPARQQRHLTATRQSTHHA